MAKSILLRTKNKGKKQKPEKPYPEFPLFAHGNGSWAKKIKGELHYFGPWNKPTEAKEKFDREWPYLKDGRIPPSEDGEPVCSMQELCNRFLTAKQAKLDSGELSQRSFADYHRICRNLLDFFGKHRAVDDLTPDDFQSLRQSLAKRLGVVSLKNEINRIRVVFKFASDHRLIDRPVHYGSSFDRPSAKALRKARNQSDKKMFDRDELLRILEACDPVAEAMVLLGVNCGLGNTDIATLPQSAIDFETGWLDFPRPKTEIHRRIKLWPETIEAVMTAIELRPEPADPEYDRLVFLTNRGVPWVRMQPNSKRPKEMIALDALSQAFRKLLDSLDINGHRNFYTLRHVTGTVGGEAKDPVALSSILGHVDSSMAGVYRESISDERLEAVTDCIRKWLWPDTE